MRNLDVVRAWGRILAGSAPAMSIEITRRCPLSCPGCYAYRESHLGAAGSLSNTSEFEGDKLVDGIIALVDLHRPLHLSIVGGEPLVRRREISRLLPELEKRQIHTQIVTSAVRPVPIGWRNIRNLNIVVSIDGLSAEHNKRRAPATYDRILKNIAGHEVTVHCTVTRQMACQSGHTAEFLSFWSEQPNVRKIWLSLYTPQVGESSDEMLPPKMRLRLIDELLWLRTQFPKLELPPSVLNAYKRPPSNPSRCIFALTTQTISADLKTGVRPCQLGGKPDCQQCGCVAAAALEAVGRYRLPIGVRTGTVFKLSRTLGLKWRNLRTASSTSSRTHHTPNPVSYYRKEAEVLTSKAHVINPKLST